MWGIDEVELHAPCVIDWIRKGGMTMPELILNDEQAKLVDQANGTLLVRDTKGRFVGRIQPELSPEMIAELKRRAASPGPWYTGEQYKPVARSSRRVGPDRGV
jgi:hypothetical protein